MKVLVIGKSTRNIVSSAKKAGHTVYALDQFGDLDTLKYSDKCKVFSDVDEKGLSELAKSFGYVDSVILGTGYEHLKLKNIFNNRIEVIEEVGNKFRMSKKFISMDIPHPVTESLDKASGLNYPIMIKPRSGSGGILNTIVKNEDELLSLQDRKDATDLIAQEFIEGIPCSVSLISNRKDAVAVATNEQLIGTPWLTNMPFAYCGNITPFNSKFNDKMIEYSVHISTELNLVGSNGVDFMLTNKGPVVIEVNARFQGSLDTVEMSTGINIFDAHMKSFYDELPEPANSKCFAGRTIVFAKKKTIIDKKISDKLLECNSLGRAADIPLPDCVVQPCEPIVSLMETGKSKDKVFNKIKKSSLKLRELTQG